MFWNFSAVFIVDENGGISVYTYTLITILLELRKLRFSKDFMMDLKGKNPGGHWWKWERLKLGTLEKELSDLNISNRIYNQTFIFFHFFKNYQNQRKIKREFKISKWKIACSSCLHKSQVFTNNPLRNMLHVSKLQRSIVSKWMVLNKSGRW